VSHLIAFQRFNMRGRVRALNLYAPIMPYKPVRAGVGAYNGWVLIQPYLSNIVACDEAIGGSGFFLLFNAPFIAALLKLSSCRPVSRSITSLACRLARDAPQPDFVLASASAICEAPRLPQRAANHSGLRWMIAASVMLVSLLMRL
jgi:hypothetical protein